MPMMKRCLAIVERDATCKPKCDVYLHEVPVLEALHGGRGSVTIVKHYQRDVTDFDVYVEHARIQKLYNRNDNDVVALVYGREMGRFARACGVTLTPIGEGEREPQVFQALVEVGGDPYGDLSNPVTEAPVSPLKAARGRPAKARAASAPINTAALAEPELAPELADASGF